MKLEGGFGGTAAAGFRNAFPFDRLELFANWMLVHLS